MVGKWINDQLKKLSSSDVEQCLNLKFKYDENEVEDDEACDLRKDEDEDAWDDCCDEERVSGACVLLGMAASEA